MSEEWVPFDKRNAAMLNAVGFSITDEPGDEPAIMAKSPPSKAR
jgi:hypothetical protein